MNEANETKDTAKLSKVATDFEQISQDVLKSRAPEWFKGRVAALSLTIEIWALSEMNPSLSPQEIMDMFTRQNLSGTPFEGRPDKLLDSLGFFKTEDFGPPYRILLGYGIDGRLQLDESQISEAFLFYRAQELFKDLTAITQ